MESSVPVCPARGGGIVDSDAGMPSFHSNVVRSNMYKSFSLLIPSCPPNTYKYLLHLIKNDS
jgi:hypothetical protein